jgi:hypothetical protein
VAATRSLALAGTAAATYAAILGATNGNLGLQGAGSTASYASYRGFDPTAYFRSGQRVALGSAANGLSTAQLVDDFAKRALAIGPSEVGKGLPVLLVVALVAMAVSILWERRLAPVVIVAAGLAVLLVLGALWFADHYNLMIQSTFGERRLYRYAGLSAMLLVLVVAEVILLRVSRLHQAVAAAVIVTLGAAVLAASISHTPALRRWQRAAANAPVTRGVYDLISTRVPCDARILPNFRSEGVIEAVTGRRSVLEGMSPYLRPAMLGRVLQLVRTARGFFHHPIKRRSFLRSHHIDYILSIPQGDAIVIGQYSQAWTGPALSTIPWLHLVGTSNSTALYQVTGAPHTLADAATPPRACSVASTGG